MIDFAVFKLHKHQCEMAHSNATATSSSSANTNTTANTATNETTCGYFSKYDDSYHINQSILCSWMMYPLFMRQLLEEPNAWAGYRKTAERKIWNSLSTPASMQVQLPQHSLLSSMMVMAQPPPGTLTGTGTGIETPQEMSLIPMKLTTRQLYFLSLLCSEREEFLKQESRLVAKANAFGIPSGNTTAVGLFMNGFEWGEDSYMLKDYPWDDLVIPSVHYR